MIKTRDIFIIFMKHRYFALGFVAIASSVMISCASKPSQPKYPISDAQEVFNAFTEIDASTSVGINFSKYTDKVIAIKTALEKYKSSGKAKPEVLPLFEKALDGHIAGVSYCQCGIKHSSESDVLAMWRCQDKEFKNLISIYPSIAEKKDVKAAIEENKVKGDSSFITRGFEQQGVLTVIWLNAKLPVLEAQKVFLEDVKQ
jgi:hypothetical protein